MTHVSAEVARTPESETPFLVSFRLGSHTLLEVPANSPMDGWAIIRATMPELRALARDKDDPSLFRVFRPAGAL